MWGSAPGSHVGFATQDTTFKFQVQPHLQKERTYTQIMVLSSCIRAKVTMPIGTIPLVSELSLASVSGPLVQ
jgi:hypothetical protein